MTAIKRKKILFVSARLPYPTIEGHQIRTFGLLSELSKYYDIHLLSILRKGEYIDKNNALGDICQTINGVSVSSGIFEYLLAAASAVIRGLPLVVTKYVTPNLVKEFTRLSETIQPDIIHFDLLPLGMLEKYIINKVPFVLNEHNVESDLIAQRISTVNNLFMKLIFIREYKYLHGFEKSVCAKANAVLACSASDKDFLTQTCNANAYLIPNGVDTKKLLPVKVDQIKNSLVFLGGMGWYPNRLGLIWFIKEVLPLIQSKIEDVQLRVIGNPEPNIEIPDEYINNIEILGFVDDFRPIVSESSIMIVPLNLGSGTRLKILEGMSLKKCIVSTSKGAEGIDAKDKVDIIIADSAEEFSAKVIECLSSTEMVHAIENNAREMVVGTYDWEVIGLNLLAVYKELQPDDTQ